MRDYRDQLAAEQDEAVRKTLEAAVARIRSSDQRHHVLKIIVLLLTALAVLCAVSWVAGLLAYAVALRILLFSIRSRRQEAPTRFRRTTPLG